MSRTDDLEDEAGPVGEPGGRAGRLLAGTVVLRGTVAPGTSVQVQAPTWESAEPVVTGFPPKEGERVTAGEVIVEMAGRPVIALPGKIPAYRDIRPGDRGVDVEQLQRAPRELGYAVGDPTGVFGTSTEAAVRRMHQARGYEPPCRAQQPDEDEQQRSNDGESRTKTRPRCHLKADEVVFPPRLPARVTKAKAGLGDEVKGVLLELATGELLGGGRCPRWTANWSSRARRCGSWRRTPDGR